MKGEYFSIENEDGVMLIRTHKLDLSVNELNEYCKKICSYNRCKMLTLVFYDNGKPMYDLIYVANRNALYSRICHYE